MKIGIDLDGVCYDFVAAFRSYAHERFDVPYETMPQAVSWDFPVHDWGWDMETFLSRFHQGVTEGDIFWVGAPYKGVAAGIRQLREQGHEVHIVTHRENVGAPGTAVVTTARWLAFWGVEYDALHFVRDKTLVAVDVFIEDNVKNFQALWEHGVPSFLRNQPYNTVSRVMPHVPEDTELWWRVDSFEEFAHRVHYWNKGELMDPAIAA